MLSARPLAFCLAITLLPPAIRAQEPPSSLGAVQGTLLAADTRQPIIEASVWLESTTPTTQPTAASPAEPDYIAATPETVSPTAVKTDPAGRFLIPKVKPGDYYVLFSAQGYLTDRDFVPPAGALATAKPLPSFVQKVTVAPGKTADITLSLEHGGAVEGTVRFADGRPGYQESAGQPAGLPVALGLRRPNGTFARVLAPAHTDAQGHFRIPDVPAGSYLVFVPLPGGSAEPSSGKPAGKGSSIFYGDTARPTDAKRAVVHGTETTSGIDITLPSAGSTGTAR